MIKAWISQQKFQTHTSKERAQKNLQQNKNPLNSQDANKMFFFI